MQLSNRLFFEQVEAMLAEGHEVQIRMKGHSMRPLLRSERDIAVLTPVAAYAGASGPETAAQKENRPQPGSESGKGTPQSAGENPPLSGSHALQPGDVVLFRCEGRHILHRILRIETESREVPAQPAHTTTAASDAGSTSDPASAHRENSTQTTSIPATRENPGATSPAPPRLRFTLAGDGNYRMTEHCAETDIAAVMTSVIRPSGRIVRTASRRWRRQSRCWLATPAGVRRFILRVLWRLGIR